MSMFRSLIIFYTNRWRPAATWACCPAWPTWQPAIVRQWTRLRTSTPGQLRAEPNRNDALLEMRAGGGRDAELENLLPEELVVVVVWWMKTEQSSQLLGAAWWTRACSCSWAYKGHFPTEDVSRHSTLGYLIEPIFSRARRVGFIRPDSGVRSLFGTVRETTRSRRRPVPSRSDFACWQDVRSRASGPSRSDFGLQLPSRSALFQKGTPKNKTDHLRIYVRVRSLHPLLYFFSLTRSISSYTYLIRRRRKEIHPEKPK
jgi:hypothetical protein